MKQSIVKDSGSSYMNFNFFSDNSCALPVDSTTSEPPKKKRGRPAKTKKINGNDVVLADQSEDNNSQGELTMLQSNQSYIDSYDETNNMLRGSVMQIDTLQNEINTDLQQIRSSKTLKKKYDYIAMLAGSMSSLIGTKVTAIREINKSTTDSHNLELKRTKELKLNEAAVDDDKAIMDMYNAFISTPVGTYSQPLGPTMMDMTMGTNNIVRADIPGDYVPEMTSSQNMMRLEHNPNIKTVVVYDASTGTKYFDVIDKMTGQPIPNVERPDAMFLEDTNIDLRNNIARNNNLDRTYDLVIMNNNVFNEY